MAAYSRATIRNLVEVIRAELAWYPGRSGQIGRIVMACVSVMLIAEVFRIPGAILGASFPILISRENLDATKKTAFHIGLACSIGTADAIVGGMLTAGSPFLHVMWVGISLFTAFYVISSLNFINASLTFSAVVALAIRTWDYPISAEARIVSTLYTWLAILLACGVSVLIEAIFVGKHPPDPLLDRISLRLSLVKDLLTQSATRDSPPSALAAQLVRSAAKGTDDLCQILATASYSSGLHDLLATAVALTRQLIELGATFVESNPSLSFEDQQSCRIISQNIESIRASLARPECPVWIDLPSARPASNAILMEIERTTDLIAQSFCNESFRVHCSSPAPVRPARVGELFVRALRNGEHMKFAIRGTLSALLCYLFYMSMGWMGIAAPSILTCTLTARRLTGAGRQRLTLRFAGFLIGAGLIGWGTEVLILPQLNTIAEYGVLFASVAWIGSWIATSGPRIAFSGFQIVLAYNLVNLNRFTINTSLAPGRDAVLGVLLGVVAMWLVFDHLWAEASGAPVRSLLLETLRRVARLNAISSRPSPEENQLLTAESSKINQDLDRLRDLADLYAFESFPKRPRESLVNRSILTLAPELRALLLTRMGLLQQSVAPAEAEPALIQEVEQKVASVLYAVADAIETETPKHLPPWNVGLEALSAKITIEEERARSANNIVRRDRVRLGASLLGLASDLERQARLNFAPESDIATVVENLPAGTTVRP